MNISLNNDYIKFKLKNGVIRRNGDQVIAREYEAVSARAA